MSFCKFALAPILTILFIIDAQAADKADQAGGSTQSAAAGPAEITLPVAAQSSGTSKPEVVFLWPVSSPTLQGADEKEITTPPNPSAGQRINSIKNVHNPSIEVHLAPADKANGTAIIVAPGGGHRELNVGTEGTDIAKWLNDLGIAAIILKYRLAQTPGYHYTVEGEALQDT